MCIRDSSYGGDYIIDEAAEFWRTDGDKWVNADPQERMESFRERGYVKMVDNMRDLCHAVNCDFDRWFSERSLYVKDTEGETAGTSAVDRAFEKLDKMGYLYTKDGALWFRSTDLGLSLIHISLRQCPPLVIECYKLWLLPYE